MGTKPNMRCGVAFIIALSVSPLIWKPVAAQENPQPSQQKKKAPQKSSASSLTGCVDQQDGEFVLINVETRSVIANLVAEGFSTEGFAKHVGHKVTVRGTSSSGGAERPIFKVRSVETISESCGP